MKAECIDNSWCADHLTEGKVYDILGEKEEYFIVECDDDGRKGSFYKERFVIIDDIK